MAIGDKDIKLLWGRAAGICSNPGCRLKLTDIGEGEVSYLVGEMAHVIARNVGGPRTDGVGGDDTYDNLILLCPTCHRKIDKSPNGTFSEELLYSWKRQHEKWIVQVTSAKLYDSLRNIRRDVMDLLEENKSVFQTYGPHSEVAVSNPGSNSVTIWSLRKLDMIIPNNKRIMSIFQTNRDLIPDQWMPEFRKFSLHANGFERNQYDRQDYYPLFPASFALTVSEWIIA